MSETVTLAPQEAARSGFAFEAHDFANVFPMLDGEHLQELAADIAANGLLEPITLYKGKILDGRGRFAACQMEGVQPTFEPFEGTDTQALDYVARRNILRRHLTSAQRSMAAAKIADLKLGSNQHSEGLSIGRASRLLKTSASSVARALKVIAHGDPALVTAVESGQVSVSAAAATVRDREDADSAQATSIPTEDAGIAVEPKAVGQLVEVHSSSIDKVTPATGLPTPMLPTETPTSGNLDFRTPGVAFLVGASNSAVIEVAVKIAATISVGGEFPGFLRADRGTVLWLSNSLSVRTYLRPKFAAAGADFQGIRYVEAESDDFGLAIRNLSRDLGRGRALIRKEGLKPRCVIVDHLADYFRFNTVKKAVESFRTATQALGDIMREFESTVVIPCHLPTPSKKAIAEAATAACLSLPINSLYVVKRGEQEGRGSLAPLRNDGTPGGRGFGFRLAQRDGEQTVAWDGLPTDLGNRLSQ